MIGFYVSVVDGKRRGLLLGPFETHAEALERVDDGRRLAQTFNDDAFWYGFGTARVEAETLPEGRLNAMAEA
jgi:hypothetical protein